MSYTLHIFRGTEWEDGADDPITAKELLAVDGIKPFNQPAIKNPKTGMVLSMGSSDNMFSYGEAVVMLNDGIIDVAARDEDVVETIRPLAQALDAVIQGDEGEYY